MQPIKSAKVILYSKHQAIDAASDETPVEWHVSQPVPLAEIFEGHAEFEFEDGSTTTQDDVDPNSEDYGFVILW